MFETSEEHRYDNANAIPESFTSGRHFEAKMQTKHCTFVFLGLIAVLWGGCAMSTPMEEARADAARKVMRSTLAGYAEAIRQDDVDAAMKLVADHLPETKKHRLRHNIRMSTWLELYTGYQIDDEATLAQLNIDDLNRQTLTLDVVGNNGQGQELIDSFTLGRHGVKWHILDLQLHSPREGVALDLPETEMKKLRPPVRDLMTSLRNGETQKVMSMLPDSEFAKKRRTQPGLVARLFGEESEEYQIREDVERATGLDYLQWPSVDNQCPIAYAGPGSVMACYDVAYAWPERGIENDSLRIEILLLRETDHWDPKLLRLYGEAIPGTD